MAFRRPILALAGVFFLCSAQTYMGRDAVIVAGGEATSETGTPVVSDVVNGRVPSAPLVVNVELHGGAPVKATVHWSSPNGGSDFGPAGEFVPHEREAHYDAPLGTSVAVYRHLDAVGGAVVVAEVGPPVNQRATLNIENRAGIGFGCYGFIRDGPSVSIVAGKAQPATLATADVAVVGPGGPSAGPAPGCWGENYDPASTAYRLVFAKRGRVGTDGPFLKTIPLEAFGAGRTLQIEAADGRTYTIHGKLYAGTYIEGWIELPQDQPDSGLTPPSPTTSR